MKRNILYTFCLLVIITIQTSAQQTWVPFLQQTKTAPITTLSLSNNSNVSFSVQINGLSTSNKTVGEIPYQSLSIPDGELMRTEGSPQVPMITKLIAIPDCDNVSISIVPSNEIQLSNYDIVPAPRYERKDLPDGDHDLTEVYEENKLVYSIDNFFPNKYGEIIKTGYVRDQKVVSVAIYPVQFNPVTKKMRAFTTFNVTLSFVNPKSAVNKELGIFSNMMHHTALNYVLDSTSASTRSIGTSQSNSLSKASPNAVTSGSVTRVTNLSTLVGTNAIPVDYLIITHSSLFNSSSLTTLANHRRDYNGFDVAIVQVSDIYTYKSNNTYQGIRDYIADVYNLGKANNPKSGHLAYILLAGDALQDDNSTIMLPAAYPSTYGTLEQGSDYYYSCVTQSGGIYDDFQDVMYGRLSVGNETELSNTVNKIINYEANSNNNWNNHYTFVAFSPDLFSYADPGIKSMTELIPPTYQKSYAFRAYSGASTTVTESNPIYGQTFTTTQYNDPNNLCGSQTLNDWLFNNRYAGINSGIHTFVYEGHAGWNALGANEGSGRYIFRTSELDSRLNNTFYSFMIFNGCQAGYLDYGSGDCVAEVVVNLASKGAIGCLASTRDSDTGAFGLIDKKVLNAMYNGLSHIMGEAVMESKLSISLTYKRQYNLYGDPALNLWPTGYTISENLTLSGTNDISTNITVPSGVTLTIAAGSTLRFNNSAKLTVNGILTANGGSASTPITFNFLSPNSTSQNGIIFNSGSSGTISYCKVLNAYNGIYENGANVNVSNSAISYCTNGLYLYNSSPTIQACNIHNNTTGIYLISSSPYFYNNYIQNNSSPGVNCSASSNPKFGNGSTQGNNYVSGNLYGVFAQNNSIPMLGKNSTVDGGYNNIVNNTQYNVYNMSSNSIYAEDNWWGSTTPSLFKIAGTSGVSTSNYLSASVSIPTPPLSKTSGSLYTFSSNSDIPLLSELNKANQYIAENNLDQAKAVCYNLINNYPDYSVSFNALNLLKDIYSTNNVDSSKNVDSVKNIYQALFNNKDKKKLYAMAGLLLADIDKENKLKHLDDVINNYGKDSVVELALTDKFIYYYFDKNDRQNALAVSKQLDNSYPLGLGAIEAHQILGDTAYYNVDLFKRQVQQNIIVQTPTEYALSENYPNPFNPTTVINYQTPKNGLITIKVYDVLGKEIKALVDGFKVPGKYSVSFDASKLASGIYFYQLRAGSFILTKKMLLLK